MSQRYGFRMEITEVSFDRDRSFMLVEIDGDEFHFLTVSAAGATVDKGVICRSSSR